MMQENGSTLAGHAFLLPPRQAQVLAFVERYYAAAGEGCPAPLVARQLGRNPETIRECFTVLHRKGWLKGESSPAVPVADRGKGPRTR